MVSFLNLQLVVQNFICGIFLAINSSQNINEKFDENFHLGLILDHEVYVSIFEL